MILSRQSLKEISCGSNPMIQGVREEDIQTSSVDLPLGDRVYRMEAASTPRHGRDVAELLKDSMYTFDLVPGSVLERGAVYIIPLRAALSMSRVHTTLFSPKSSIGRLDTFVRVVADGVPQYDQVEGDIAYEGPLYAEIIPQSFNTKVAPGLSLTQVRVRQAGGMCGAEDIQRMHANTPIVFRDGAPLSRNEMDTHGKRMYFHLDLDREVVGFQARHDVTQSMDLSCIDTYEPRRFWTPIYREDIEDHIHLIPGFFYLFSSIEQVKIPDECCGEVVPYDVASGDFRSHYAGFFDNGFGAEKGSSLVLEVRMNGTVPQRLWHGSRICAMEFEKTDQVPDALYGSELGSHYTRSGPSLSKHFKHRYDVWSK